MMQRKSSRPKGWQMWIGRVLNRFFRRRIAMAATGFLILITLIGLLSDLIASDKPIVCRVDGELIVLPMWFPSAKLVDHDNQSLMSHIADTGGWALLPPIPFGPDQVKIHGNIQWLHPPDALHILGTDASGRDVLARIVHGCRTALMVGVGSMVLCVVFGVLLGAFAGFFGGWLNRFVNLSIETLTAFPTLFLILGIQGLLGIQSLFQLVIIIGATRWTDVARITRSEVLRISNEDYVTAAKALGLSRVRILIRHVMPSALGPAMVSATFGIAGAILIESTLTFLGYGTPPPVSSWGQLLADAFVCQDCYWLVFFPGIILSLTVLAINVAGEALSDEIDAL